MQDFTYGSSTSDKGVWLNQDQNMGQDSQPSARSPTYKEF
jgi:hypothetical protein